jgi:preprotein translocase subunit SecF
MMRRFRGGGSHYDFIGRARTWFLISGAVVVVSLASLGIRQINAGLEFRGGTAFQVASSETDASVDDVRNALGEADVEEATIQEVGDNGFLIETEHQSPAVQEEAVDALADVLGVDARDVNVTDVGPKWGAQISAKAIRALIVFLVVVAIYLTIRLELKMAGAGMLALLHDMVITAGIYSLSGFEVTPSTVIALLTILGYSLYDTVVIFDRVQERTASLSAAGRVTYSEAANDALNQVLLRSLNTSIVSLLPVGSLLFVGSFLLGASTLRELALALFIGIAAGAYSSVFIATPVLALWKERETRWSTLRARVAARAGGDSLPAPRVAPSAPTVAQATTSATVTATASDSSPARQERTSLPKGQPQRRRKKKKRRR